MTPERIPASCLARYGIFASVLSAAGGLLVGLGLLSALALRTLLHLASLLDLWRGGIGGVGTLARSASCARDNPTRSIVFYEFCGF